MTYLFILTALFLAVTVTPTPASAHRNSSYLHVSVNENNAVYPDEISGTPVNLACE